MFSYNGHFRTLCLVVVGSLNLDKWLPLRGIMIFKISILDVVCWLGCTKQFQKCYENFNNNILSLFSYLEYPCLLFSFCRLCSQLLFLILYFPLNLDFSLEPLESMHNDKNVLRCGITKLYLWHTIPKRTFMHEMLSAFVQCFINFPIQK